MDFNTIMNLRRAWATFRANHPKFPMFINAVSQNALAEGTIIEINVTSPDGKNYCTNVKLNADDIAEFAVGNDLLDGLVKLGIAQNMADHDFIVMLSYDADKLVHFVLIDGERLFEQHIVAFF